MTRSWDSTAADGLLSRLVGFELYSVEFVMDYVQLRFHGDTQDAPVLTCYSMPKIEGPWGTVVVGQVGYADVLRGVIRGVVRQTREESGTGLRVELDRATIVVHPARETLVGPEIALLQGFADDQWMCWRPGEDAFEDLA